MEEEKVVLIMETMLMIFLVEVVLATEVELEMEEVTVVMGSNGDDDNNADFCIPKLFAKAIPHLSQKK